jgi:chromate transporter
MEDQVVARRKWLSREEFLDMIGMTNLIPGPNSTEMAIHVGNARAGFPGLLVAGASFIAPAALLVTGIAWAIAFLRADLVGPWHWLTPGQLLDAVAVGQVTPGPVFTTATFIGFVLAGPKGALLATLGIFAPAFFFVAVSGLVLPRLRRSPVAAGVLDGVNARSLALMAQVTFDLGRSALVDMPTVGLLAVSAMLLLRFQVNSAWLVVGGGLVGLAIRLLGGGP